MSEWLPLAPPPLLQNSNNYETMYMYVHFLQLIHEIQRLGYSNEQNETVVQFGTLFDETVNTFDTLSGILKTAKKHLVKIKSTVYSIYH